MIRYQPGDFIELRRNFANEIQPGPFEILRLLATCNGEEHYRVRGPDGAQHVIGRSEIQAVDHVKAARAASTQAREFSAVVCGVDAPVGEGVPLEDRPKGGPNVRIV